jgi:hypothetical protein
MQSFADLPSQDHWALALRASGFAFTEAQANRRVPKKDRSVEGER